MRNESINDYFLAEFFIYTKITKMLNLLLQVSAQWAGVLHHAGLRPQPASAALSGRGHRVQSEAALVKGNIIIIISIIYYYYCCYF